jgi:GT2 family glycosyltransferase
MAAPDARTSVVMVTRDRRDSVLTTLRQLQANTPEHRVVVVDNDSGDGTADAVAASYPAVSVIRLRSNLGGGGRAVGAWHVDTPYVAFSDDDSWWAPHALQHAARVLDAHPRLAVLAARVLVGGDQRVDPVCQAMAGSPLPRAADMPGPLVLGFVACGAVVRRDAFLQVGGFHLRYGIGGEEELLAIDLARAGWGLAYVDEVVAHHHPSPARNRRARQRRQARNALWTAWLRRPLPSALRQTRRIAANQGSTAWGALLDAGRGLPWVLRERRSVPPELERALRLLEASAP